ncbi:hypothetical protein Tco_0778148 [Tanacetum coccineum]
MEQSRGTVQQHLATVEETHAHYESLFNNLVVEVEKVNMVNYKLKITNADLTTELARYKEKKKLKSDFQIHEDELLDKQSDLEKKIKELDNILVEQGQSIQTMRMLTTKPDSFYHTEQKMALEAAKFVQDFKSLAKEADDSLDKIKALEFEIKRLLRAVVSQDIMFIVQNTTVVETSDFQTKLEQCKYDKLSYDKTYNDMQHQIEPLQAQLGDLKGKSSNTSCASNTLDHLTQKLENENVSLKFKIKNYAKENAHLNTAYKNLFYFINVTWAQTKGITDSLQNKLHNIIYENTKLRAQLSDKLLKERSIVSLLQKEKKNLKSDFQIHEDELLVKQIDLEKKIKELDNILVEQGQSIQTMHMLTAKPDSFYHTEQKMALEKHDPPVVYDSEKTLQLAQEIRLKMKQLNKEIELTNYVKINKLSKESLDDTPSVARKFLNEEADDSLDKIKALEFEIKRLLRAVISQDIMSIVQNTTVVETSDLLTELERTKERFENCIIKKENEYATLWNDWYKKCEECKYDKLSYDKAYNDMQHQIERLQAQLGDLKGKSSNTPCASNTLDHLSQKLENENASLEFKIKNCAKEDCI